MKTSLTKYNLSKTTFYFNITRWFLNTYKITEEGKFHGMTFCADKKYTEGGKFTRSLVFIYRENQCSLVKLGRASKSRKYKEVQTKRGHLVAPISLFLSNIENKPKKKIQQKHNMKIVQFYLKYHHHIAFLLLV